MTTQYDDKIIQDANRIRSIGEEVIGGHNLEKLLANKKSIAYDGFEPSNRIHIAQGLLRTINTNKLTASGCEFIFWVADWFALMNLKMGGKDEKIRNAGELMIHTWKACGMNMENVKFIWASEEIARRPTEYWKLVLDISTSMTLKRILKCGQIMGRKESFKNETDDLVEKVTDDSTELTEEQKKADQLENANRIEDAMCVMRMTESLKTSQVFYPVMQCADIFFLGVDICSLGMDQRKVNMLAIEYCDISKRRFKPIIVSHHMMMGLTGVDKMSKSDPNSAIFMDDTDQEVNLKIKKAFCEPQNIVKNPILEYFRYIVFEMETEPVMGFPTYQELEKAFADGSIHPNVLKESLKQYLKKYLDPVRKYFENNKEADNLRKLVKSYSEKTVQDHKN